MRVPWTSQMTTSPRTMTISKKISSRKTRITRAMHSNLRARTRKKRPRMQLKKRKKPCKTQSLTTTRRTILSWSRAKKFKRMTNWRRASSSPPLWSKAQGPPATIVPCSKVCRPGRPETVPCSIVQAGKVIHCFKGSNFTRFQSRVPRIYQMSISTMRTLLTSKAEDPLASENRSKGSQNCLKPFMKSQKAKFLPTTSKKENKLWTGARQPQSKSNNWPKLHRSPISGDRRLKQIWNPARNLQKCTQWSSHPTPASGRSTKTSSSIHLVSGSSKMRVRAPQIFTRRPTASHRWEIKPQSGATQRLQRARSRPDSTKMNRSGSIKTKVVPLRNSQENQFLQNSPTSPLYLQRNLLSRGNPQEQRSMRIFITRMTIRLIHLLNPNCPPRSAPRSKKLS